MTTGVLVMWWSVTDSGNCPPKKLTNLLATESESLVKRVEEEKNGLNISTPVLIWCDCRPQWKSCRTRKDKTQSKSSSTWSFWWWCWPWWFGLFMILIVLINIVVMGIITEITIFINIIFTRSMLKLRMLRSHHNTSITCEAQNSAEVSPRYLHHISLLLIIITLVCLWWLSSSSSYNNRWWRSTSVLLKVEFAPWVSLQHTPAQVELQLSSCQQQPFMSSHSIILSYSLMSLYHHDYIKIISLSMIHYIILTLPYHHQIIVIPPSPNIQNIISSSSHSQRQSSSFGLELFSKKKELRCSQVQFS